MLNDSALPRDALPYTDEFETLKARFQKSQGSELSDHEFWTLLSKIGKYGGVAGKSGRKHAPKTPSLSEEDQLEILRLFPDGTGNRDNLPYTNRFDEVHRQFKKLTGRQLSKHEFWRGLSRVAKLSRKPKPLFDEAPLGGLPAELIQFLERTNPWWKGEPTKESKRFRRWAFNEAVKRLDSEIAPIVVIRGPRRVGKSTIQEQVVEHLLYIERINPARIFRVQFDDVPALGTLKNPIEALVRWYERNVLKSTMNALARSGEPVFLLFDEVQNITSWSEQLKSLVDNTTCRTLVTGSSALRISAGKDSLAGRMTPIELGPLRLWEIAGIRGLREMPQFAPDSGLEDWKQKSFWLDLVAHGKKYSKIRTQSFDLFSDFGGYPLCHSGNVDTVEYLRQQIVNEVVTKTIEHDLRHRPQAPSIDQRLVREIFRLVCRYSGQAVRPKRLAEEVASLLQASVPEPKVAEAIRFLTDSMLVHCVAPLEMLQKKQDNPQKLCLCDHFVRNGVLQETVPISPTALENVTEAVRTSAGHLIESIIGYYLKGVAGLDIAWWPERPNEPEVDFILTIGTQRIPLEVKYRRKRPDKNDLRGITEFCNRKHYSAPFGLVITQAEEGELADNIVAVPASTFLLVK